MTVQQFGRRRSITILLAVFLQVILFKTMFCKEKKKLIIHEINTLGMRSVPSLSSTVGTRAWETES